MDVELDADVVVAANARAGLRIGAPSASAIEAAIDFNELALARRDGERSRHVIALTR